MEIIIHVYICEEGHNCLKLQFVLMEVILHLSIKERFLVKKILRKKNVRISE